MSIEDLLTPRNITLVALLVAAVWCDMSGGRIPNVVTLPFLGAGIVLNAVTHGWLGLAQSLGAAIAIIIIYLLAAPKVGIGGGDVKLMAAVGAVLGGALAGWAVLISAIAGGAQAIGVLLAHRSLLRTTGRMAVNTAARVIGSAPVDVTTGGSRLKFRYSPAIAVGSVLAVLLVH